MKDGYRKLIRSSHLLTIDRQPLSAITTIVSSLKVYSVKLIDDCNSDKQAKKFIDNLVDVVRVEIGTILNNASAFTILCVDSLARKPGSEVL